MTRNESDAALTQRRLDQAMQMIGKLETQLRLEREAQTEPLAIVGMGCRFPGGIDRPEALWKFLQAGRDAISDVPNDRWSAADYKDVDPEAPGKIVTSKGGFLSNIDQFDAAFFEISAKEAAALDPQQRLLLEVAWHCLEDARMDPEALRGSNTGVFLALSGSDYLLAHGKNMPESRVNAYLGTGNSHATACGRLSYFFGFEGPSHAVDTACSSSLVALHNAVTALRLGDCSAALVASANLILTPDISLSFSKAHMLAADGRCKTFSDDADGYVRAEGVGAVFLKRLADAQRDGDPIHAVIRGVALNQDGASNGLTAPNGLAQQAVIRKALRNAHIAAEDVDYVEAHGTGTRLGDPIELMALQAVFGEGRPVEAPLLVGSIKTNIGHCEAAAGLAGLMKLALSIRHRTIPAHLNVSTPTRMIDWAASNLRVASQQQAWPERGSRPGPPIGALSAFGFGGTNGHLILSGGPDRVEQQLDNQRDTLATPLMLRLSAKTPLALAALADAHAEALDGLAHAAASAHVAQSSAGRGALSLRRVIIAPNVVTLVKKLRHFSAEIREGKADIFSEVREAAQNYTLLVPGEIDPAVAFPLAALDPACDALLTRLGDASGDATGTFIAQLLLAAFAGARLSSPARVLAAPGAEIAAACHVGILSPEDALRLHRALLAGVNAQIWQTLIDQTALGTPTHGMVALVLPDSDPAQREFWRRLHGLGQAGSLSGRIAGYARGGRIVSLGYQGTFADAAGSFLSFLPHRGAPIDGMALLEGLAQLWCCGISLRTPARRDDDTVRLPLYPFQRRSYWYDYDRKRGRLVTQAQAGYGPEVVTKGWVNVPLPAPSHGDTLTVLAFGADHARACAEQLRCGGQTMALETWLAHRDEPVSTPVIMFADDCEPENAADALFLMSRAVLKMPEGGRLLVVTSGAVTIGAQDDAAPLIPSQACLWGGVNALRAEMPGIQLGICDLDPKEADRASDLRVIGTLSVHPPATDMLALRDGQLHAPRLQRSAITANDGVQIDPEAVYLIAGGFGALGLAVAERLVDRGARYLALTGRSGPRDNAARERIARMRASGIHLYELLADISDQAALGRALETVLDDSRSIGGVFNAAGVAGRVVESAALDRDEIAEVLAPKVRGTINLATLLDAQPLAFFVNFSSISSVWGSSGQLAYTAANQFLDRFARHRIGRGLPICHVNWGPWADVGMSQAQDGDGKLASMGIHAMAPEAALNILDQLLGSGRAVDCLVAQIDWAQFAPIYRAGRRNGLLDALSPVSHPAVPDVLRAFHACPKAGRRAFISGHVQASLRDVCEFPPDHPIPPNAGLREQGLDSLMSLRFKTDLELKFGVTLSATVAFDYPTSAQLRDHLLSLLDPTPAQPTLITVDARPDFSQIDEAEAEALLLAKLGV